MKPSDGSQLWPTIVEFVRENEVSDVTLVRGSVSARLEGRIVHLAEPGALSEEGIQALILDLLQRNGAARVSGQDANRARDFTASIEGARFRVNVAQASGAWFASLRPLPERAPVPSEIAISDSLIRLIQQSLEGLILVTGPTGSGKTTTIACLVDQINCSRPAKIITIEDPIEFLHQDRASEIIQREVGRDTTSYAEGLRDALRQNADVIVVGEIRDEESAEVALQAAETGHLVIASLHASSVVESISRFLMLVPGLRGAHARYVLSRSVRLLINQRLARKKQGGRLAIREVCVSSPKIQAVILAGHEQEIETYMLAGRDVGMIDFATALRQVQPQLDPVDVRLLQARS